MHICILVLVFNAIFTLMISLLVFVSIFIIFRSWFKFVFCYYFIINIDLLVIMSLPLRRLFISWFRLLLLLLTRLLSPSNWLKSRRRTILSFLSRSITTTTTTTSTRDVIVFPTSRLTLPHLNISLNSFKVTLKLLTLCKCVHSFLSRNDKENCTQ